MITFRGLGILSPPAASQTRMTYPKWQPKSWKPRVIFALRECRAYVAALLATAFASFAIFIPGLHHAFGWANSQPEVSKSHTHQSAMADDAARDAAQVFPLPNSGEVISASRDDDTPTDCLSCKWLISAAYGTATVPSARSLLTDCPARAPASEFRSLCSRVTPRRAGRAPPKIA